MTCPSPWFLLKGRRNAQYPTYQSVVPNWVRLWIKIEAPQGPLPKGRGKFLQCGGHGEVGGAEEQGHRWPGWTGGRFPRDLPLEGPSLCPLTFIQFYWPEPRDSTCLHPKTLQGNLPILTQGRGEGEGEGTRAAPSSLQDHSEVAGLAPSQMCSAMQGGFPAQALRRGNSPHHRLWVQPRERKAESDRRRPCLLPCPEKHSQGRECFSGKFRG